MNRSEWQRSPFEDALVIHAYTRADAIRDGVLFDVTVTAREAGFRVPVVLTAAAWADCVAWSEDDGARKGVAQDEAGRLWDVVWLAQDAARRAPNASTVRFALYRVPRDGRGIRAKRTELVLHVGPGDDGEPVATILLPGED